MTHPAIERMAKAMYVGTAVSWSGLEEYTRKKYRDRARLAIKAIREIGEEPGARYTAGEYSRSNVEAFVDDILEGK